MSATGITCAAERALQNELAAKRTPVRRALNDQQAYAGKPESCHLLPVT
ncbi:MAG: hypothetical protein P8099_19725 [Gemmatimonadota bacterium]